jgi:hypothetical protein
MESTKNFMEIRKNFMEMRKNSMEIQKNFMVMANIAKKYRGDWGRLVDTNLRFLPLALIFSFMV